MESFIVYHKETRVILNGGRRKRHWGSYGAAKAHLTRMLKKGEISDVNEFNIVASSMFPMIDKMVEKTNMMTGKKYMESVNTPGYMSPSSEAYWSM